MTALAVVSPLFVVPSDDVDQMLETTAALLPPGRRLHVVVAHDSGCPCLEDELDDCECEEVGIRLYVYRTSDE